MNTVDGFISDLLDTKFVSENVYRGERSFCPNPRSIYGGELMAQALDAARKTVSPDLKAHSLHCYFHDRSSVKDPNDYRVIRFRDSRTFSHRLVESYPVGNAAVNGDTAPFFRMDCSFKLPEDDPACFVSSIPKVPAPEEVLDIKTFIKSLDIDKLPPVPKGRIQQVLAFDSQSPMDIKLCEPECLFGLKSNPTGRLHAWMRLKEPPTIPIEPYRDAILAYFSDAVLLWVALTEPHPVKYMVTLSQSIWFHNPDLFPQPDEWILFGTRAHYVGDALTLSYGGMWDRSGRPLISVAQQGLLRTQPLTPVSSFNRLDDQAVVDGV